MFDPNLAPDVPQKLALQTRKGGVVDNLMVLTPPHDGLDQMMRDLKAAYRNVLHRPVGPSAAYNCHGLTFAARRTGIAKPAQVQRILSEDGYSELPRSNAPCAGDIAIYREDGDIVHSGIVMDVQKGMPWVLGKWGDCHEVIHPVLDCPYNKAVVTYYRLSQ